MKDVIRDVSIFLGLIAGFLTLWGTWYGHSERKQNYPISLVQTKTNFDPSVYLRDVRGEITVAGWTAEQVPNAPNTYLVSFTYTQKNPRGHGANPFDDLIPDKQTLGWWWEVDTEIPLVRAVSGDSQLERKYGLGSAIEPSLASPLGED